ncbi:guanosine polyphosphate pyrophosphohydrolase [Helicobacter monodelphidis]|uniref:Ppx/GppA phosphatase family protein n=1 Tax=Helicobacter sp. 15-1451 TaxID=2004995 RepID=UPI000DCEA237|nr:Ppx/GppA phosphatase family protein [Helicobacter sp. 15-1451]RAX57802.1 guanosine polyphosphate pyrophosphohydrolase [Helicobacter sp. 15-1451]
MAKITAVIDIGSNSARMAIFKKTSRYGFYLIEERKSRVRISENSYQNGGYLQKEAIERAICALRGFLKIAHEVGARKILCVATSALRDAPNRGEFLALVRSCLGLNIKIITGEREAFYGAVAALNLLPYDEGVTIDIGGGSSECALIQNGKIVDLISLDLGTIRLKELFFDKNMPIHEMLTFIQGQMQKIPYSFKGKRIFGIGGTIRALSKAIMEREEYPLSTLHAFEYNVESHQGFFRQVYEACDTQELVDLGISEDRFDNIRGGALIFSTLLKHFEATEIVISGVGVREGVFLTDALRNSHFTFPKGFNPSIRSLVDRFSLQDVRTKRLASYALRLFDVLYLLHQVNESYRFHLKSAARLLNIGTALNFYQNHKHGGYFLVNGLNYGFTHADRILISMLVESYGSKKPPNVARYEKVASLVPSYDVVYWLSIILAIAEILATYLQNVDFKYQHGVLVICTQQDPYLAREAINKLAIPQELQIQVDWLEE